MKCKTITMLMMFVLANYLASAQGLSVEPNTNIKVLTGTTLKVKVGDLVLKSDATGDATVIAFGNVTHGTGGNVVVQRYMPGAASAWHTLSAPVNGMAITGSDWEPDTDEDFFLWDEPSPGTWVNYKNTTVTPTFTGVNPGNNFVTGRGYIVDYNSAGPTNNFESSALNTGNINITLAKSTAKSWTWGAGLNLIGNPYASCLDWSLVTKTGIVTEIYAQVYDPNKAGGAGYEPVNGAIASGQGFFVQAVSNQAVLALQPSQQVHTTTQTFMKQGADKLVLRLTGGGYFDETKILLNEASSLEHDFYDASKFFSFSPQVPQLYSLASNGRQLAINSIATLSESLVIPISIRVQGSSQMTIKLTETEGEFAGPTIILHDLHSNIQHKINEVPTYNFIANEDDNPDRFLLKFGAVGLEEAPGNSLLNAYMQNDLLYILNPGATKAQVEIYNIRGQLILCKEVGLGLQSITVNVATGAYMVVIRTEQAVATRKLFIR